VTFTRGILKKQNILWQEKACFTVARSDFNFTGKTATQYSESGNNHLKIYG
jgi:hypothetical protein